MRDLRIEWYRDFVGIGYHFYDVHTRVLLIFDKRKILVRAWKNIIKWWPDDEIKMRFVDTNDSFLFLLYSKSRILGTTWVFLKHLSASENYRRFKNENDGVANLGLALLIKNEFSHDLEIFDYKKRITDIEFLAGAEVDEDDIVFRARQLFRKF